MPALFNPITCWETMTPEQQRTFGAAGIAHLVGVVGGHGAADFEGWELMAQTLEEVIAELRAAPPRPDLTALGIRTCRVCGCTDNCGCEEGCYWVENDLCSSCIGSESKGKRWQEVASGGRYAEDMSEKDHDDVIKP
jgi:hypothetical protein